VKLTVHVALVSAYPSKSQARDELGTSDPYLGVWRLPEPYGGVVHVFGRTEADRLNELGWTVTDWTEVDT